MPLSASGKVPARAEQVERLGEYIVVYEARINREQTHKQNDISPTNITLRQ
jgi:hypothetical protein